MERYSFKIAFNGEAFNGWQRQRNTSNTIQELIENAFRTILRTEKTVVGCGRTDKGVHAHNFYFHCDLNDAQLGIVQRSLNRVLPESIAVLAIQPKSSKFNARYSAISRTYRFYFHIGPNVFLRSLSQEIENVPDLDLIHEAINIVKQKSEFRNFCKSPDRHKHTICTIMSDTFIERIDEKRFFISIQANRFLKSMMRILAYRLLAVGENRISLSEFEEYFSSEEALRNIPKLPPQGLFLHALEYP